MNFIGTLLGFSIILPFLVYLVADLGGNSLICGLVGATYSAFQRVGAPLLGSWSVKVGRTKVLLVSQLGTLISWGIFIVALLIPVRAVMSAESSLLRGFTLTVPLLLIFLARACDGLTGGNVSVANACLADTTSEQERSRNFGRMSISANLGFIPGPALAGILSATHLAELLPVLPALGISFVGVLLILLLLPESSPCPPDALRGLEWPVLTALSRRFSETSLVLAGTLILALNFFILMLSSKALTFPAALFFAAGNGLMWPSFLSLPSKQAGGHFQGAVQGAAGSAGSLASIIGLVLGGLLYEVLGAATFLVSGILIVLAFVLALSLTAPRLAAAQG